LPTLREAQAFALLALDPASETLADRCSYRFRKERSTQDAMAGYLLVHCRRTSTKRILEEEVRVCFNHLDQDRLLEYIPTNREKLRAWLRAGYLEQDGGGGGNACHPAVRLCYPAEARQLSRTGPPPPVFTRGSTV